MGYRVFLAGASGAIGRRLAPLLRAAGHEVAGTTRSPAKADALRAAGVTAVVVDVFDADALSRAVAAFRPEIVIHQLTDLPAGLAPDQMAAAIANNARIRDEGTRNLVAAAGAAGARRMVAQSIAWAYAPGPEPHAEADPLDLAADGLRGTSVRGVAALEQHVLNAPPIEGVVLRYGRFYGSGTGVDAPPQGVALHVDAAAHAAMLAMDHGGHGIFNIAEPGGPVSTEKAQAELGWRADFRPPVSS